MTQNEYLTARPTLKPLGAMDRVCGLRLRYFKVIVIYTNLSSDNSQTGYRNRIWLFPYQLLKAELDKNNLLDLLRLDSLTSHV